MSSRIRYTTEKLDEVKQKKLRMNKFTEQVKAITGTGFLWTEK